MWSRTWRAWSRSFACRSSSSRAPTATRGRPVRRTSHRRRPSSQPGSLTTRSGRRRLSSVATCACVSKSQCSSIPAISTTRLSWISPQRPRTLGRSRSALRGSRSRCAADSASLRAGGPGRSARSTRWCARPRGPGACRRPSGATPRIGCHEMLDRLLALLQLVGLGVPGAARAATWQAPGRIWLFVASASAASAFSVEPSDARASSSVLMRLAYWARTTSQVAAIPTRRPMTSPMIIGGAEP